MIKKIAFASFFFLLISNVLFFKKEEPVDITIVGPVKMADGLGRHSVEFIEMFKSRYRVNCQATVFKKQDLPAEILPYIKKNASLGKVILYVKAVWDLKPKNIAYLEELKKHKGIKVAYSMFESSVLPKGGVEALNKYFDLIVVPDPYLVEVYKSSGVNKPIAVLPLALDFSYLKNQRLKEKKNDLFTFTILSSSVYRKNILGAIRAFDLAFSKNPNVRLVINSRNSLDDTSKEIQNYLALRSKDPENLSSIIFTQKALSKEEYVQMMSMSDCLLNPSMGEGFSIQPREAMVLGIPVILTDNTAQSTICKTGLVKSVPCKIVEKAQHYFSDAEAGDYFPCLDEDLALGMLHVYSNYSAYFEKREAAKAWALSYDLEQMKDEYLSFFELDHLNELVK